MGYISNLVGQFQITTIKLETTKPLKENVCQWTRLMVLYDAHTVGLRLWEVGEFKVRQAFNYVFV
jgi:hypothetical protein